MVPRALLLGLLLGDPNFAASLQADTELLAKHLVRFREFKVYKLNRAEYAGIQSEFVAWVDARMKSHNSAEQINQELWNAKLLWSAEDAFAAGCVGGGWV